MDRVGSLWKRKENVCGEVRVSVHSVGGRGAREVCQMGGGRGRKTRDCVFWVGFPKEGREDGKARSTNHS